MVWFYSVNSPSLASSRKTGVLEAGEGVEIRIQLILAEVGKLECFFPLDVTGVSLPTVYVCVYVCMTMTVDYVERKDRHPFFSKHMYNPDKHLFRTRIFVPPIFHLFGGE